ncbi:hypothetical protein [Salinimicrobium sp. TH3]|uniref:hypothetical protein n=1 Tax=Salinimicrobium sp. TH3 TaxID=2997342 RepID=UPI0022725607|nr:hypothetical protein [Salinimicrobium sp. TH3]MCY2685932.1 hypothetical protein [Salinimicrobium sp. TH3]
MKNKALKVRALNEILQEINNFGRFKNRKGNPIYNHVLSLLKKHKILIQSKNENSKYWYPGENYTEAIEVGTIKYMRSSKERSFHSFFEKTFYSEKGIFFSGLMIGFLLGGTLMYMILEKLLF